MHSSTSLGLNFSTCNQWFKIIHSTSDYNFDKEDYKGIKRRNVICMYLNQHENNSKDRFTLHKGEENGRNRYNTKDNEDENVICRHNNASKCL